MAKRVFIIGSGFSRPAGLPTSNELLDIAIQNPLMAEDVDFNRWRKHLSEIILHIESSEYLNIEQFFDYAQFDIEFWRMKNQKTSFENGESELKESWLNDISEEVYLIISNKQKDAEDKGSTEYIKQFAKYLTTQDTIITFNYDTLVELAIKNSGLEWDHGLDDFSEYKISVLKMHGSIDWILLEHDPNRKMLQKLERLYSISEIYKKEKSSIPEDRSEYKWDLWRHIDPYAVSNHIKCMISNFKYALGYAGLGRLKHLSMLPGSYDIWEKAGTSLYNADEVYVIGFSMAEYDIMCRMLFADIVQSRHENQKPSIKLTIIDPKCKDIKHVKMFKQIFKPIKIKPIVEPVGNDIDWSKIIC